MKTRHQEAYLRPRKSWRWSECSLHLVRNLLPHDLRLLGTNNWLARPWADSVSESALLSS